MSTRRKIARNALIQLIGKIITASSTILVTMLIIRHFGPAGFGDFITMITFPTLFWIMADFGFNAIAIREISKDRNKSQSYFSNLLLLRLGLATLLTLIALTALYFLPYSPLVKLGASLNLGTIFMMAVFTTSQAVFQANLKYIYPVLAQCAGAVFNLVFVAVFIYFADFFVLAGPWPTSFGHAKGMPLQLLGVVFGSLAGNILMAGMALIFVTRFVSLQTIKWDKKVAKRLFLATLPVGLALIFDVLDIKIDSVMLSILPLPGVQSNSAAVGYYGTAFKIFEVILTIPFFFMSAIYPILVRHFQELHTRNRISCSCLPDLLRNSERAGAIPASPRLAEGLPRRTAGGSYEVFEYWTLAKKTFREAFLALLSLSVFGLIAGQVLAPWLIRTLAGAEFTNSIPALRILFWTLPVFFITSLLMHTLLALEKQRVLPWVYGAALILNFVLNLIFIPRHSFLAAAVITGVTEAFILVCLGYFVVLGFGWKGKNLNRH